MPRLLSVNVGLPRDVTWNGKTVRTAIWKSPVEGRQMVRKPNVVGDAQGDLGGHGGEQRAVFVYQMDSYHYWERVLGRNDFIFGQFGENFTVEGLPDDEVCIGDRYRIGGAEFEVTQPRVTCYRVGIRMNEPRMPALLVAHHRPGFYFRVLQEGEVGADDDIVKIADGPERISVADVDALLYLPGHTSERTEVFGSLEAITPGMAQVDHAPHPPPGPPGSGPPVSFARSGITAAWDPKFASLLELAEACDVPVRWSCRAGVCHTCMTGLIGGSIIYNPEPLERPTSGNVLVCCSQPNAGVTLDL